MFFFYYCQFCFNKLVINKTNDILQLLLGNLDMKFSQNIINKTKFMDLLHEAVGRC